MHASDEGAKTSAIEDLKALFQGPRDIWIIYLATLLEYLGIFSFLQTLPLWLSGDHGMNDKQAGWWASTFSMMVTLFMFFVGGLADTFGVRRMLIASFALAAVTRLGMSAAATPDMAIATLLAFGFAYATTSPVLQTAVQRASNARTRSFAFSLWYVSFNIAGAIVGPMIDFVRGKFLDPSTKKLAPLSMDLPLLGTRMVSAHATILALGFLFAALAAVVVLFLSKDFEHGHDGAAPVAKKKTTPIEAFKEVLGDKLFWRFMVMLVLLSLVRMMFQHMHFTWPKYVTREQGDSFPMGTVWSINSMAIIVLAPLGTALTRNFKPFQVLLVGAAISSLSPFVLVFGSSLPYQLGMIAVLTVGEALWSPRLYEYNVSIAPRGREATYVSLASLPYFLAKFLVGPTSGYLLATYCPAEGPRNPAMLWGLIGVSTIIGPIGIWLLRGWIQKKDEAPAAEAAKAA
jgi:MFS family permease